jgi:hypothetical protein
MKYYFLIAVLLGCNPDQQPVKPKEVEVSKCYAYPPSIDSLNMQDLYDSARWYVYTEHCDILYRPKSDTSLSKPFGELELRFDDLFIRNDTLALIFNFMDKEEPILPSMTREYQQLETGVGFDVKTRKKIYMISSNMTVTYKGNPKSRYENPLQPEVLAYIKSDWDKLDACFKALVERKGINP